MANWPSRVDVKLPDSASRDIGLFVDKLPEMSGILELSKAQTAESRPNNLLQNIADKSNVSLHDIGRIFNTLENMIEFYEDLGSYEAVIDRLITAVPDDLKEKLATNKSDAIRYISQYGRNNPVAISYKAQRLTYLREKLFHEAEIVTDARPIFDESGENIIEIIVTHELILTILEDQEFKRDHLSIDNADILAIRKACDRALVKAQTVKRTLDEKCRVEVLRDEPEA